MDREKYRKSLFSITMSNEKSLLMEICLLLYDIRENTKPKKRSKPRTNGMVKPTMQECKDYAEETGLTIDPVQFWNKCQAIGWTVGKNKADMKDWQAAMRTWERNNGG